MSIVIPKKIRNHLRDQQFKLDEIGLSDSTILMTEKFVLKISPLSAEANNEVTMLQEWLPGKLPVPKIIEVEHKNQQLFVLMERLNGLSAAEPSVRQQPQQLMQALAKALKLDINSCPSDQSLKNKLDQARSNIRQNRVDIHQLEAKSFGLNGITDPMALLIWLEANQPKEDLVFSHGDFCLPNVFFSHDVSRVSGYIDLGRAGIADRYQDIALAYRSLKHNFAGVYDDYQVAEADAFELFTYLEITPDWDKINYYRLLDELF